MDSALRRLVRERADNRCEYCGIHQKQSPFALFHIDHIIPKKHGGNDDPANLALACHHCNFHKGTNLTGLDPQGGILTPLFPPRTEEWQTHFQLRGAVIVGLTSIGRTTVRVLNMNATERVQLRARLSAT